MPFFNIAPWSPICRGWGAILSDTKYFLIETNEPTFGASSAEIFIFSNGRLHTVVPVQPDEPTNWSYDEVPTPPSGLKLAELESWLEQERQERSIQGERSPWWDCQKIKAADAMPHILEELAYTKVQLAGWQDSATASEHRASSAEGRLKSLQRKQ